MLGRSFSFVGSIKLLLIGFLLAYSTETPTRRRMGVLALQELSDLKETPLDHLQQLIALHESEVISPAIKDETRRSIETIIIDNNVVQQSLQILTPVSEEARLNWLKTRFNAADYPLLPYLEPMERVQFLSHAAQMELIQKPIQGQLSKLRELLSPLELSVSEYDALTDFSFLAMRYDDPASFKWRMEDLMKLTSFDQFQDFIKQWLLYATVWKREAVRKEILDTLYVLPFWRIEMGINRFSRLFFRAKTLIRIK